MNKIENQRKWFGVSVVGLLLKIFFHFYIFQDVTLERIQNFKKICYVVHFQNSVSQNVFFLKLFS